MTFYIHGLDNMFQLVYMGRTMGTSMIYVGERPPDFGVVTALPPVARYAEEIARELGISTCIALTELDDDVDVALEIIGRDKVKLLATRGYAEFVLRYKTNVPILTIGYSAENFFETLLPYQNTGLKIGHLCFPEQGQKFLKISQLLGLRGIRLETRDRYNIEDALERATQENVDLLIGGLGLLTTAQRHGFRGIPLLAENRDEIWRTFLDARTMLAMRELISGRQRLIQTILDTNPNIILHIDDSFNILYANNSAISAFSVGTSDLTGTPLNGIFPNSDFARIVTESVSRGEPCLLWDLQNRKYLAEVTRLHGANDGYIFSLASVQTIRKGQRKLRQNRAATGRRSFFSLNDIKGKSPILEKTKRLARKFAASASPVLIIGPTGSGKEMFAQAIHAMSQRSNEPLVSLNCASFSETLLESELFGYEEGAFTSARRGGKEGLLEVADGGTIFLDEIGEMPLSVQARLLRVLQDKLVTRLGASQPQAVDLRIICGTNRNIMEMIRCGTFRADLFYRVNTLILRIPALSERKCDIPVIARAYCSKNRISISDTALEKLMRRDWPGNVRELIHVLERAVVLSDHNDIQSEHICFDDELLCDSSSNCESVSENDEANDILGALRRNNFRRGKTADELGISRATLWKKLKKLNI